MLIAARSDTGQMRPTNEDSFWYNDRLLVVADGMGGHKAGEVASQTAVDTVKQFTFAKPPVATESLKKAMHRLIHLANRAIYDLAEANHRLSGMGTTITIALLQEGQAIFGHVGDSRAYVFRSGQLMQVTSDHSVAAELLRSGGISERSAATHPQRHMLTRALGADRHVNEDSHVIQLQPGDGILLCTDGLTNVLSDTEIGHILNSHTNPDDAIDELITRTNAQGAPDNVTVVFARDTC